MTRRPQGYRAMVYYIAMNADTSYVDPEEVAQEIPVDIVAETFGKSREDVAAAVIKIRVAENTRDRASND